MPSHVQFFSKSKSENGIKVCSGEVTAKLSWLLFYISRCRVV